MRKFNTSGPNIPEKHYTIERTNLINKGLDLILDERYFTIWAPRQTGKSTYFVQLANKLNSIDYQPVYFSVEGFNDFTIADTFDTFCRELRRQQSINWQIETLKDFEKQISNCNDKKLVMIIDEIESLNPAIFSQFLHTIRNLYHTRKFHCLKSVILVGVSNIVGVVSDNASPFNIADNLNVPYFSDNEVLELLHQHETETEQLFEDKVKHKISQITANQPGLVNGFANKLVEQNPDKNLITYENYLKVEDWYLTEAIDKNFSNILNKAKEQRNFVERLLFTEEKIPFEIDRESIKLLHTNGLIKKDENGYVTFWVPFYKKRLYKAFYPYTNGEKTDILRSFVISEFFDDNKNFKSETLITHYKEYVKRRGFNVFRDKDVAGNFLSIKESALIYSFETYIQAFLQVVDGKSYREADTGLGKSDLIININSKEYLVETKIYYYEKQFFAGKKQLAYYCKSLGLNTGIYLVFCPNNIKYNNQIKETIDMIDNVCITTFLIEFDETKW
jgi:succinate dehydrogenase flavin-adding protein (antitoxin of CptAB toxin-antitoxin module)